MPADNVIQSAVGDIHVPGSTQNAPIDTSIEFTPQNPFTIDIPKKDGELDDSVANPGFPIEPEKTGFIKTALNEFKETSTEYHELHAIKGEIAANPFSWEDTLKKPTNLTLASQLSDTTDKFYHPAPDGWSPKQEIEKLSDTVDPKYLPKLLATKSPVDFNFQMDSIRDEATRAHELQNGSTLGKIVGGALGLTLGSLENFIPLASIATKAKLGAGFLSAAARSSPGILGAAAIHEGAAQMDKVDGNLPAFLKDTFIDTAFGMALFGAAGATKTLVNMFELNSLKRFARDSLDGIGFNFKVDKKGNLKGFEAVDTTGSGSLSAAKVTRAQEHADAAFYKGGIYKIPVVGEAVGNLISGNIGNLPGIKNVPFLRNSFNYLFGSPLVQLKMSDYPAANAFADAAFDHFITTEGEAKGGVRPKSFEFKVKQTRAQLTALKAQTDALHAERNGYGITARPTLAIQNAWGATKQITIDTFSKESHTKPYVSQNEFMDEIQRVLYSGESSQHAAVNDAAAIYRKLYDDTAKDFLKAHNLPDDYFRNMDTYLSRVYDTKYMNENEIGIERDIHGNVINETGWIPVMSKWFAESDALITQRMKPIKDLKNQIKELKNVNPKHELLPELKVKLKQQTEKMQNELRNNPEYDYHIKDRFALSADEATELKSILKPLNDLKKKAKVEKDKIKLAELNRNIQDEEHNLYDSARIGKVNPRLFNPLTHEFKNPNDRLKFRDVFKSQSEREAEAKYSYNSIMNLHPEDIVSDIFGHMTGNKSANSLMRRSLMVPDKLLYDNNFMTKDLYSKASNYVNFLSKRTHLKTSFDNMTVNGDFEELAGDIATDYQIRRARINQKIETLTDPKEILEQKKLLRKEAVKFNEIKTTMKTLFENRMMGINKRSNFDTMSRRTWMSITAAANLHNLAATQITDLGWGGFQHGIWPYIRDGIYPIMESLGGILKTKDAEALREMAPHVNLGFQDMLNNYADRNWHGELQPDINMGKIVNGVEKIAHFSALTDLTPYVDNGIQRANASVIQSRFMELLHKQVEGTLSNKESLYLRKYGIDPKAWGERMVTAYKDAQGFKTKLGGYMSRSWQWQDAEAANVFNDATFRGIQNTLVWKGMADSPFFADNILGMFFHTFTGWTYAATNRYLIPSMQHADGEMLLKMMWMAGAGALVSPMRRITRGDDPLPADQTPEQHAYEVFQDSGIMSSMGNVLAIANLMSSDKLLGDLKNDKYKNRMKTGIFGTSDVISSTAARISDVLGMANSGLDEKDLKTAAHMLPITGAMYGHYLGDKLIEGFNLPRNKRAAELSNG